MISLKSLFTLQFSLQRQTPLMDMASHSRLRLPFSLFLISSVFISLVSDSRFFTCSLKPSQTLTISHSIKSKPFPQIQSSKLLFLSKIQIQILKNKPQPPPMPQMPLSSPLSASNAQRHCRCPLLSPQLPPKSSSRVLFTQSVR